MAEVKERIKELVDQLEPEVAIELEQWLSRRLAHGDERGEWHAVAAAAFSRFFDDSEIEYTEDDLPESA